MTANEKYLRLKEYLKSLGSVAVAFSGGVDSIFLLNTAYEVLGEKNVIAITASSDIFPLRELKEAEQFCTDRNIRHFIYEIDALNIEGFKQNPQNRCYLCKSELFKRMLEIAEENQVGFVIEGSNLDDEGDYRPGLTAVKELGIKSPLRYTELTKEEIRKLSKEKGLPAWNKPSFACLASRFVYGETISEKKLRMVDKAEQYLFDVGFHQVRVRIHGDEKEYIARVEVLPEEFSKILEEGVRRRIYECLKDIGFSYVSLDLKGYRTGSMNETLDDL